MGAEALEYIGGPVPAIGGLEHQFGLGPGSSHGLGELERLADEALGAEHLAVLCHPHDGRVASMQVDSDVLSHWGLLLFRGFFFARPSMLGSHKGRRPRPFITSVRGYMTARGRRPGPPRAPSVPLGVAQSGHTVNQVDTMDNKAVTANFRCFLVGAAGLEPTTSAV